MHLRWPGPPAKAVKCKRLKIVVNSKNELLGIVSKEIDLISIDGMHRQTNR